MANKDYTAPKFRLDGFNCPHCGTFAKQNRYEGTYQNGLNHRNLNLMVSFCDYCHNFALRKEKTKEIIRPNIVTAPLPNEDMPDDVKELYEEARKVSPLSPRAAAALLRVSLEKLTAHLGETEGKLNTRIGNLKKQGLPESVIQSLDILRITANEGGSHSGEIDLTGADNQEIVDGLFFLVNYIVERIISNDKKVKEMYGKLPKSKIEGIINRDSH